MAARQTTSPSAAVLPRGVRRALDLMASAVERDIGLAELATAAGLSGRALQRQFRRFLGKTPYEALCDIRFDRARRLLLQGAPGLKIMDVASRCGFAHFGRFSTGYRRRYGETPSQTQRRQAVFAAMLSSRRHGPPVGMERPGLTIGPIETDPGRDAAAHGIADELAVALTRAGVAVAGRPGSVRYHLSGTIRGSGPQSRLLLRLIDRESGRHLWAHRLDGPFEEAEFDEHIATRVAAGLYPALRGAEVDRALGKPDTDLGAQDLALRALPGVLSLDAEGNARALDLLNAAMDRDAGNALAVALAAWAHGQRVVYHFGSTPLADRTRSGELAKRALTLQNDATVLAVVGNALSLLDTAAAEPVVARALAIDGSSAWAWSRSGWIDAYKGSDASAIERLTIALELAPNDPLAFNNMVGIGIVHFNAGRYRESAHWQARALAEHPSAVWIHRCLCPAYELAGAKDDARSSVGALRTSYPTLTLPEVFVGLPPFPQSFCDRIIEGLHGAGLPS